jgi:hypothetical protein
VARLRPTRAPLGRCSSQFSLLPAQRTDRRSRCGSRRQVRCAHGAGFDVDLDLADLHAEWKSLRSRNARLYAAALKMPDELYRRATGVFFKSLHGTLNRAHGGPAHLPCRCVVGTKMPERNFTINFGPQHPAAHGVCCGSCWNSMARSLNGRIPISAFVGASKV